MCVCVRGIAQSEIRRALRVGAPARSDKLKPPRTMEQRILNAYLQSIAEDPSTAMDKDDEELWLASQRAKVAEERLANQLRGTELTSEESSRYSSASEMTDLVSSSSSGESFEYSSGADSELEFDEEM